MKKVVAFILFLLIPLSSFADDALCSIVGTKDGTFVISNVSGRTWQLVLDPETGLKYWMPLQYFAEAKYFTVMSIEELKESLKYLEMRGDKERVENIKKELKERETNLGWSDLAVDDIDKYIKQYESEKDEKMLGFMRELRLRAQLRDIP